MRPAITRKSDGDRLLSRTNTVNSLRQAFTYDLADQLKTEATYGWDAGGNQIITVNSSYDLLNNCYWISNLQAWISCKMRVE